MSGTMEQLKHASRLVVGGLIINTLLAVGKILSGVIGNSYALIADGIESCLDIFSSLVVWSGLKVAAIPPDENHPYGHGKAESLSALIVALGLLGAAAGIGIQSIREIVRPHHSPAPFTLVVLVAVIIIKEVLFRLIHRVGAQTASTSVQADAWHHRSDSLTSAAAFIGIGIALIGGPGYESADDVAALFASGIIVFNDWTIFRYALAEVMDEAPSSGIEQEVKNLAATVPGVKAIEQCRVRKSGVYYLVDIHVEVEPSLSVREGHNIAREVRNSLCKTSLRIRDVLVHIEPHEVTVSQEA